MNPTRIRKPDEIRLDVLLSLNSNPATITYLPEELRAQLQHKDTRCTAYQEHNDRKTITFTTKPGATFTLSIGNQDNAFTITYTGVQVTLRNDRRLGPIVNQEIAPYKLLKQDTLVANLETKWSLFAAQKKKALAKVEFQKQ